MVYTLLSDDVNRIILKPLTGVSDCQRDYINACYVDVREFVFHLLPTQNNITTMEDF